MSDHHSDTNVSLGTVCLSPEEKEIEKLNEKLSVLKSRLSASEQKIAKCQRKILEHGWLGARQQDEIERLKLALKFYANHIHWMEQTENSEFRNVLIAAKFWDMNGWTVAEEALNEPPKQDTFLDKLPDKDRIAHYLDSNPADDDSGKS